MTWNLFVDDERNVEDVSWAPWQVLEKYRNEDWVVVRGYEEALIEVSLRGFPIFISFDHDLGAEKSGHDLVKRLIEVDMKKDIGRQRPLYTFSSDFDFYVHSKNPIGKANIEGLLYGYLRSKARAIEVPFDQERFDELYDAAMGDDGTGNITVGKLKE